MSRPVALIVNPSSGGGRAAKVLPAVEAELRRLGVELRTVRSTSLAHFGEAAGEAAAAGETVAVLSGDGCVGAVAHALRGRPGATMAVLPGGRGNDFARKLGIPADPVAACAVLAGGKVRELDVGDVDGATFVGIASFGFDTVVQDLANASRVRGGAVYLVSTLRALRSWKPATFEVRVDGGEPRTITGYAVAACNSGVFGGGMYLAPDASLEDGLLDVALSMATSKRAYLANLPRVFKGTHVDAPGFELLRARTIEVSASTDYRVYADGDPVGQLPARISAVPRAIRVLCPA